MRSRLSHFIDFAMGVVIATIYWVAMINWSIVPHSEEQAYRQGQIDALSGTVKYELVVQPDSSRIWEEIE